MVKVSQRALLRILILTILCTGIGTFVLWDHSRVDRDFLALKALLRETRYRAISKNKTLVARFVGGEITITDRKTGEVISGLNIPTLAEVNYNTTLGEDMIVFDGHGTS